MARRNDNPFAKVDGLEKNKPFTTISEKQATSPAFRRLSGDAVKLLVDLKLSRKYYTGTDKSGANRAINGDCLCFYWNRELAKSKGYNNPNKTLEHMRELVRNGFIEAVENNKNLQKKSVFRFSCNWQQDDFILSNASKAYLKENAKDV